MTLEREFVFLVTAHLFLKFNNLILPHPRQKDFYPNNNKASCPAQSTAHSSVKKPQNNQPEPFWGHYSVK